MTQTARTALIARQDGYLLVASAVILLSVAAMLASFSFVSQHDSRFKANYAAGQRLARLAVLAHNFAQTEHFNNGLLLDGAGDLMNAAGSNYLDPPDGFAFQAIDRTEFAVEAFGRDEAPVNADRVFPQPSAYIHLKIRTPAAASRPPSDMIAFLAGAGSMGLNRVGVVGLNTGDDCDDGKASLVRWGPESTACLNGDQAAAIGFSDVQAGDIIIPAWETATGHADRQALFRFPQPERPDINYMNTALAMNGNAIQGVQTLGGDILNNTGTVNIEKLTTRQGKAGAPTRTELTQGMDIGADGTGNLRVLNQSGTAPAMALGDGFAFTIGNDMNVAGDMTGGDIAVAAQAGDPPVVVSVNNVGETTQKMTIQLTNLTGDTRRVNVNNVCDSMSEAGCTQVSDIRNATLARNTGRLNVSGNFDAGGNATHARTDKLDIYASKLVTSGSASLDTTLQNNWYVGALDQTGAGKIIVKRMLVHNDCTGSACPDNVTQPPPDEVF